MWVLEEGRGMLEVKNIEHLHGNCNHIARSISGCPSDRLKHMIPNSALTGQHQLGLPSTMHSISKSSTDSERKQVRSATKWNSKERVELRLELSTYV